MTLGTTVLWLLLGACGDGPNTGTLSQNVGAAFAPCSAAEIRFLSSKHNVMTAFEPCGNNNFQHFRWSPSGTHLYFQLVFVGHIMDADAPDKRIITVPTRTPQGPAAWLTSAQIAIPVGPEEPDGPPIISLFDMDQRSVYDIPVTGVHDITRIHRGSQPHELLLVGTGFGQVRGIHRLDTRDGSVTQPYASWLSDSVDDFTYSPVFNALVVSRGNTTTLHAASDGTVVGSWSPAKRGTLHPEGRWLALEHDGDPISIFYQRSWDELSERARERELARARQFEEKINRASSFQTTIQPPTLSFVALFTGQRHQLSSIYGRNFQWYQPTPVFGSLLLWGFEGKEFKRNVILGNFGSRLRAMMDEERSMMGVERWEEGESSSYVASGSIPTLLGEALAAPPSPTTAP